MGSSVTSNVGNDARMISVLIVEDNPADVQLFKEIFSEYRISNRIDWAGNGEEALAYIEKNRPDLVLLDTVLPRVDGFEVLARVKANPDLSAVKVVMVSGSTDQDGYIKQRAPNSDGYLVKPITLEGLAAMVSRIDKFAVAVVRY